MAGVGKGVGIVVWKGVGIGVAMGVGADIGVDLGLTVGVGVSSNCLGSTIEGVFAVNSGSDPKWARTNTHAVNPASAPHKPTPDKPQIHHGSCFRLVRLDLLLAKPSRGKSGHCTMLCEVTEGALSPSRSRPAFSHRWSDKGPLSGRTVSVNPLRSALIDSKTCSMVASNRRQSSSKRVSLRGSAFRRTNGFRSSGSSAIFGMEAPSIKTGSPESHA